MIGTDDMKVQPTTKELIAMLYERLPELFDRPAAPVQEPVAWLVYAKGSRKYFTLTFDPNKVPEIYIGGEAVPLYTTHSTASTCAADRR
jgi:hypothetical protein